MPISYFSTEEFKSKAAAESLPEEFGVRKQFIAEVKANDESKRQLSFTISTDSVDRDSDKIAIDGWELANYRKNPVILWAHDSRSLPIGRSVKITTEDSRLKSLAEFTPVDLNPFGDQVYRFYQQGFLSAVSVGFAPKKWAFTDDKERKFGVDFMKQELLEYSAVPVPANPQALIDARKSGLDVAPLVDWAARTLRELSPEISTERDLEGLLRDVGGLSKKQAQAIVSRGFRGLRDSEPPAKPVFASEDAKAMVAALRGAYGLS